MLNCNVFYKQHIFLQFTQFKNEESIINGRIKFFNTGFSH
jgi:hypothetical protein